MHASPSSTRKEIFGVKATKLIVATASYGTTDPTRRLAASVTRGHVLYRCGTKIRGEAIRKTFDPGLDEAISIIVATSFKSIDDPRCEPDPDYVAWRHFMRDAYAEGI